MDNQQLQKWALVAEIAGGISVVISLVFVGFQVRQSTTESIQNTLAVEASAYQDLAGRVTAVNFEAMTNPEFGDLIRKVHSNQVPAVDPVDVRVSQYLAYTANHVNMAFVQFQKGLITEEQFQKMSTPLFAQLRTDVGKMLWPRRDNVTDDYKNYIESYMRNDQPGDPFWQR